MNSQPSPAPITGYPVALAGARLHAMGSGALHWPDQDLLVVSDLHLGKSERMARRGGSLLPPYETRDTLARLAADLAATAATRVICLGDSFDDAEAALDEADRRALTHLMAGRNWTWIAGNHDPVAAHGAHLAEVQIGPLTFRHIAVGQGHEVSGHYHPKARLAGVARPCFLADARHMVMPAYGTYTGGLWCHDPVLADLMGAGALAILTGPRPIAIPCPPAARRA